jgi:hypothetical protein
LQLRGGRAIERIQQIKRTERIEWFGINSACVCLRSWGGCGITRIGRKWWIWVDGARVCLQEGVALNLAGHKWRSCVFAVVGIERIWWRRFGNPLKAMHLRPLARSRGPYLAMLRA